MQIKKIILKLHENWDWSGKKIFFEDPPPRNSRAFEPPPPGISNPFCGGGGVDIFWNYTM